MDPPQRLNPTLHPKTSQRVTRIFLGRYSTISPLPLRIANTGIQLLNHQPWDLIPLPFPRVADSIRLTRTGIPVGGAGKDIAILEEINYCDSKDK